MSSLPTSAIWSIAVAAVLCPIFAFLVAIAVEILIGWLMDAGVPVLLPLNVAVVAGSFLLRVRAARFGGKASAQT